MGWKAGKADAEAEGGGLVMVFGVLLGVELLGGSW